MQNFANFAEICYFPSRFSRNFAGISQNFSNFDEIDFAISKFQKIVRKSGKFAGKLLDIWGGSDVEFSGYYFREVYPLRRYLRDTSVRAGGAVGR